MFAERDLITWKMVSICSCECCGVVNLILANREKYCKGLYETRFIQMDRNFIVIPPGNYINLAYNEMGNVYSLPFNGVQHFGITLSSVLGKP